MPSDVRELWANDESTVRWEAGTTGLQFTSLGEYHHRTKGSLFYLKMRKYGDPKSFENIEFMLFCLGSLLGVSGRLELFWGELRLGQHFVRQSSG
jgi:hypothetical protein